MVVPAAIRFVMLSKTAYARKQKEMEDEFRECIMSVATGLRAGYSLENAFMESMNDMKIMFGEKGVIVKELKEICGGLTNNISLEKLLGDFAGRSRSLVIREFADILQIASRNGGDLTEIIGNTAECMEEENRLLREMEDMVSGRKFEGKIMSVIPFLLAIYIQCTNPGYLDMFYQDMFGRIVMTICFLVYLTSVLLIHKILDIAK